MRAAWIEPFAGIAGDMTVAAFLDLGMPLAKLRQGLAGMAVDGYEISAHEARRGSFRGTRFVVRVEEDQPHRHLADVRRIIEAGSLPDRVRERALLAFAGLADAEAAAHGSSRDEVHFHEVGAVDAIVDIVGAALALEHFDVDRVYCSRIRVGTGEVTCEHGTIPVPAPGTMALLGDFPVLVAEGEGETTTPTGAAILAAWAVPVHAELPFRPERTGYGAGTRTDTPRPNLLRVTLGRRDGESSRDDVVEVTANIDDQPPELLAFAVQRLMEEGALDAFCTPVVMKKGRPAVTLTVLAREADLPRIERTLFRETTTFGLRKCRQARTTLARHYVQVETAYGRVRVKVGTYEGEEVTASPEYEDCVRIAAEKGVPAKVVYAAAVRAIPERR